MANNEILDNVMESVKKQLNVADDAFDEDLLIHVNTVFYILSQMGVGPDTPVSVDLNTSWSDLGSDIPAGVKSYVYLKTRMLFDPPSGAAKEAAENMIAELEWRLNLTCDLEV